MVLYVPDTKGDMDMEFCNLIGSHLPENIERKLGRNQGIPLRITATEALEEYGGVAHNVWVESTGDEVAIRPAEEGYSGVDERNLFSLNRASLDGYVFPPVKKRGDWKQEDKLIWADVQDTDENPAIIVVCKALHMVNGVKTYVKLLNVNKDYIVALLVCGAIGFEDDECQILFMSRNLPEGVSVERRDSQRIDPSKLNEFLSLKDSNGYQYNMDMAISAILQSAPGSITVKALKNECLIFDPQAEVRAKALADALAEKARKEEELKAQKAAEDEEIRRKQQEEADRQKEIERIKAEARREASKVAAREKAAATRAAKKAEQEEKSEIKTPEGSERNAGAEFFLAMLGKC